MVQKYLIIDVATGKKSLGSQVSAGGAPVIDQYFTATSGQTVFTPSQVFTALSQIDVLVNGVEVREGASYLYQRNAIANTITFNSGVLLSAEVKIRIWL